MGAGKFAGQGAIGYVVFGPLFITGFERLNEIRHIRNQLRVVGPQPFEDLASAIIDQLHPQVLLFLIQRSP